MGIYTCTLTLNAISSDVSNTGYSLVVKPLAPIIAGNLTAEEGSALDLTCQPQSSGMPSPVTYTWSTGASTQTLHVNSVGFSDAGPVTCTVYANGISSNASATSTIMVQVRKPTVKGPTTLANDGGSSVTLNCSTPSSVTPTSVTWYGNQDVVIPGQSAASYTISSPSLATSGSFKCSMTYNSVVSALSDGFVLQVQPQQPDITGSPRVVATGSTVTLICSSGSQPPGGATLSFTWKKDHSVLSGQTDASLVINAEAASSSGQYACAATYLNVTSVDSKAFNLTVQDPPLQPTIKSSLLQVSVGSTVTLTCENTSTPVTAFTYTWWKGGVALAISAQTYKVEQAKTTDAGAYTCAVTDNSVTSANSSAYQLTVVSGPNKPAISVSPASIDMGSPVNISCDVSPFDPAFTYAWTMNGTSLSSTSLVISIASFQQANVGLYACTVAYGTQQNTSDPRLLSSVYPPQSPSLTPASLMSWSPSFVEGDSLSVDCAASCSPACTYRWSKDADTSAVSSTSRLSVSNMTSQSAGRYTCTASNSQGSLAFAFNLTVLAVPNTPTLTATPLTFASGQSVSLSCSSSTPTASASLTYTWLRNGVVLQGQSAALLTISSFGNSDTGRYTCKALVAGKASSSSNVLELVPTGAPDKPTVTLDPATPVENSRVEFRCNSTGLSYRWYYDGDVVANETQQNYTIDSVGMADQGSYACDVTAGANLLTSLQSDAVNMSIKYGPSAGRLTVTADISSEATTVTLAQGGSYSVPPGTQAVMTCRASCNEECGYEWMRDGTQLATVATLTQEFTQVQLHEGNYSCKASNSIGSYGLAFYVKISGSADTVTASRFSALILACLALLWNSDVIDRLRRTVFLVVA